MVIGNTLHGSESGVSRTCFIPEDVEWNTRERCVQESYSKAKNFPGGTSATILENINQLVKSKPDRLIVHAGANDLVKRTNLLNQAKKLVKQVKKVSQYAKIVFSRIITRKDRKNINKKVSQVKSNLKNYCNPKNVDFIDNGNLKEEHLGQKKLHLSINKGLYLLSS